LIEMESDEHNDYIIVRWTRSGRPTPEDIIDAACAGMVSRRDESYPEFVDTITFEHACDFLTRMIELGHESVLEHITFQFWVSMSRVASHQQVRHRMASYTQMSHRKRRSLSLEDFVIPPAIRPGDLDEWLADTQHTIDIYNKWLAKGYESDVARRKLTQETRTDLVMTMNARSLRNYFSLRATHEADFEISDVAKVMYSLITEAGLGFLFSDIGQSLPC
jgi:thymidylate synthase (FAD)